MGRAAAVVVPLEILAAMGELNRAVRAAGWNSAPKHPVYAYKRQILETLADAGALICRPILVSVPCRTCGGSGRWTDWWGYSRDYSEPCSRCSAKGRVHLRFVLSTLPDGQQWHTPAGPGIAGHELLSRAWGPMLWEGDYYVATLPDGTLKPVIYEPVFDWRPGETAKDGIAPERCAELLNLVEAWMPPKLGWQDLERFMMSYRLDIGHGLGSTCWHCGEACPDETLRTGICSAGHEWLTWSMRTHRDCRHPTPVEWPIIPPDEALTPHVRTWLARRAGRTRIRRDDW